MTALKTAAGFGVVTPTRAFIYFVLVLGVALMLTEHHLLGLDIGNAIPFSYSVATLKSHSVTEPSHRRQRASPEAASRTKTCSVNWGQGSSYIRVKKEGLPLYALENAMPNLLPGGRWFPTRCTARHRVAIVVPYWDRLSNLEAFLQHMHPFLQDQQLDYSIYLVEQNVTTTFNKAKLYNAGYEIAKVLGGHDCFIFHDVDLLPENRRNEYACRDGGPFHMTTCIDRWNYKILYPGIFGGVCAMTSSHMERVNGFSNVYWGWGGEDDDMAIRVQKRGGFSIVRNNCTVGRYTSLEHRQQARNPIRYRLLRRSLFRVDKDGLNSLKYRVLDIVFNRLYTHILLDVFESTDKK